MDFINENLLTLLILLPAIGAVLTLLHQMFWKKEDHLKWVTLAFTVVNFLVSLLLLGDKGTASASGFFFEKYVPWIKAINTNYHVGVDGLEYLAGDPDDLYNADRGDLHLERRRKTPDRFLHLPAAAGERDDRRFRVPRSARFLSLL